MAMVCAKCGSADTMAGTDSYICMNCRARTGFDGVAIDETVVTHLAGNYADLQRGGALVARGEGSMSDGVEVPPLSADADLDAQVADEKKAEKEQAALDAKAEKAAKK